MVSIPPWSRQALNEVSNSCNDSCPNNEAIPAGHRQNLQRVQRVRAGVCFRVHFLHNIRGLGPLLGRQKKNTERGRHSVCDDQPGV